MEYSNYFLPHLDKEMIKDWYGRLSGFSFALEAWRRGLVVTIDDRICESCTINVPYGYSSEYEPRTLHFKFTRLIDEASDEADHICRNKDLTKEWLAKANILVPKGNKFGKDIPNDEIIEYTKLLGFPVVLKPTNSAKGKGVVVNIKDEDALRRDLTYVRQELDYNNIIIEQYVPGIECRVLVVGDQVVGAVRRVPANIIGNGNNTIEELIQMKNKKRKENPCISSSLIKVDRQVLNYINKAGYTINSIPPDGEQIFLRETSNVSAGGDPVDVTNEISEAVKDNAVKAVKAIPGLQHAGVNVLIDSSKGEKDPGVIIEMNSRPMISLHLFPVQGIPRDIPRALIDLYFPETIEYNNKRQNDNLYFDGSVLEPLIKGIASAVTLSTIHTEKMQFQQIVLTGLVQGIGLRKWIQRQAVKLNLFGYVENRKSGKVRIVVAGLKSDIDKFKELCKTGTEKAKIDDMSVKQWNESVNLGFHIKAHNNTHPKELKNQKE